MDASLNIVALIEHNPSTRLSQTYQHKLLTKKEQHLFLASFYCYLKHDTRQDFVIDFDEVWRWLGFKQKVNAKTLLEKWFEKNRFCCNKSKQFTIYLHYNFLFNLQVKQKNFAPEASGAKNEARGGHNREIIMLNLANKLQIENAIKAHPVLAARIRSTTKSFLSFLHLAEHNAAREVISFFAYRSISITDVLCHL